MIINTVWHTQSLRHVIFPPKIFGCGFFCRICRCRTQLFIQKNYRIFLFILGFIYLLFIFLLVFFYLIIIMSSWFPDTKRTFLERVFIRFLRNGQIPQHVAFIMDGNRRYANKFNAEKIFGHSRGFEKLAETLSWCRDLGITQATLYAFSIENFKRPKDEVEGLMNLFREQFSKLIEEFSKIESHQVCVRVYGKIDLLPIDIQQAIAKIVLRTEKFNKFYLNVCFSYTSREEITNAMNDLKECISEGIIDSTDVNHQTLTNAMYSLGLQDPDILVRTSGEIRLSDFLLWQSSFSLISIVDKLWPDFTIWNLFYAVLRYQLEYDSIKKVRNEYYNYLQQEDLKYCKEIYQNFILKNNWKDGQSIDDINRKGLITEPKNTFDMFMLQRKQRIAKCQEYIKTKRLKRLKKLYDECNNLDGTLLNDQSLNFSDKINNNMNPIECHINQTSMQ